MQVASNPLSINFLPRPAEEKTSSRKKGGGRKGGKSKGRGQEPDEDTVKSTCGLKFMAPEEVCLFLFLNCMYTYIYNYVYLHTPFCMCLRMYSRYTYVQEMPHAVTTILQE